MQGFAQGLVLDTQPPCASLVSVLDSVSGPDRSCPGANDDQVVGAMGRWHAVAAWAEAGRLGTIRELIRRRPQPGTTPTGSGLPRAREDGLNREVSMELGISHRAADTMIGLAWTLEARLPATAALLDAGIIDSYKG